MRTRSLVRGVALSVLALVAAALVAAPGALASGPTISGVLGQAGPGNSVGGFALLALGGSGGVGVNCSNGIVTGNSGLNGPASWNNMAPCNEYNDVYLGNGATISGPGVVHGSVITDNTLLSQAVSDAQSASTAFEGMSATDTSVTSINGGTVNFTASQSGINVVDITGLTNSPTLNFSCGSFPGCQWVVNDSGDFQFTNGIVNLGSGMTTGDVVFNVYNSSAKINFMAPGHGRGIFLAPGSSWTQEGIWDGEIIGGLNGTITLMSGTQINAPPSTPVPAGGVIGAIGVALLAGIALLFFQLRRRRPTTAAS